MLKHSCLVTLGWLLTLTAQFALATSIPKPLQPWQAWVLADVPEHDCAYHGNAPASQFCLWAGPLKLRLDATGGQFRQQLSLQADAWVPLPGDRSAWPEGVRLADQPAPVADRQGKPWVWLPRGEYSLSGQFVWTQLPSHLPLPNMASIVQVVVAGEQWPQPAIDAQNRLRLAAWQTDRADSSTTTDSLQLRVFRRLQDDLPQRLTTHLELRVAGAPRELRLPGAVPEHFNITHIDSPLPAQLAQNGELQLTLRPGHWQIRLTAFAPELRSTFSRPAAPAPWPAVEIWSVERRPSLREIDISGAARVDPSQTGMPKEWRQLPAFHLADDKTLQLTVRQRGMGQRAPNQLELERELWLDFDGQGYTVHDRIRGQLNQGSRLTSTAGLALASARVAGKPRLVSRLAAASEAGVEIQRRPLDLAAAGRIEQRDALPVSGWQTDFNDVRSRLHLPPGWLLLAAQGPAQVQTSWLAKWSLLDVFLVLLASLAVRKLYGNRWALVALLALGISWQLPGAPQWLWLQLLLTIALLRVLPHGLLRGLTHVYRTFVLLGLLLIGLPFLLTQARLALYPQLDPQPFGPLVTAVSQLSGSAVQAPKIAREAAPRRDGTDLIADSGTFAATRQDAQASDLHQVPPDTKIQTGPARPQWRGTTIDLRWQGPVSVKAQWRPYLVPPMWTAALRWLNVLLLGLLAWRLLRWRETGATPPASRAGPAPMATATLLLLGLSQANAAPAWPPADLLDELQARLTAPPECLPTCAQSPTLSITADNEHLRLQQTIETSAKVAVPLPIDPRVWQPARLTVDQQPVEYLKRSQDGLAYILLERGVHTLILTGPAPTGPTLQLALPLISKRVSHDLHGWQLAGVDAQGQPQPPLTLERSATHSPNPDTKGETTPHALVEVVRELQLGVDWSVHTQIIRQSPTGTAINLRLPLLPGESVLSDAVPVVDKQAVVRLRPEQSTLSWQAALNPRDTLTLTAPPSLTRAETSWYETWVLQANPIWHVVASGIPAVTPPQRPDSHASPTWRPWPGERLELRITRPQAVPGASLTVDSLRLTAHPGQAQTALRLALQVRSTQADRFRIGLPTTAEFVQVWIDGQRQPLQEARQDLVQLPIAPASQRLELHWRQSGGITPHFSLPALELSQAAANQRLNIDLGQDRWVLWTQGPLLGPAVLIWPLLLVLLPLAILLARSHLTPLGIMSWFLLGIGLTQAPLAAGSLVVLWLLALGARQRWGAQWRAGRFNLTQFGLLVLTGPALLALFTAVQQGLLGQPIMHVGGNDSNAYALHWYADRGDTTTATASVLSAPLWVYRLLMLGWALWLAFALLEWLRWGWRCFSQDGLWRPFKLWDKRRFGQNNAATGDTS